MLGGDPVRILCPQGLVTIAVNILAFARPSLLQGADAIDKKRFTTLCADSAGMHAVIFFLIFKEVYIISFHKLTWL